MNANLTPPADPAERRAWFTARLESNVAKAEAKYARIEERVLAAREAGIDTSKIAPPSAQSADMSLRKAEGDVKQARKNLADYVAKHAG